MNRMLRIDCNSIVVFFHPMYKAVCTVTGNVYTVTHFLHVTIFYEYTLSLNPMTFDETHVPTPPINQRVTF